MPTRYYDEDVERLQKIKSKYSSEETTEEYQPTANFRKEWSKKNARPKATSNKTSNIRLLVIIGTLFFAAWFLLIRDNSLIM